MKHSVIASSAAEDAIRRPLLRRVFMTRQHRVRWAVVKLLITVLTAGAFAFDAVWLAIAANLVWLWIDEE